MTTPFNPQSQPQPKKKDSIVKKTMLGGITVVVVLGLMGACSPSDSDTTPTATETQVSTQVESPASKSSVTPVAPVRKTTEQTTTEQQPGVPREHQQALKKAESYLKYSAFSYNGLYKQLTSEYGSGFPADAAQYAMDNIKVDWNEQAVKKAESYLKYSSFSEQGLYRQLTSEYGSDFTPEQAQHAISVVF